MYIKFSTEEVERNELLNSENYFIKYIHFSNMTNLMYPAKIFGFEIWIGLPFYNSFFRNV